MNKKKEIKKINCLCENNQSCQNLKTAELCFCPLHYINLTAWRKAILAYYEKKGIIYKK